MADKIDFTKMMKDLYAPSSKSPVIVTVPKLNFLMIDGHGDPNTSQEYKASIEALFSLAYAIKFEVKKKFGIDYGVMPLEGLWWVEDMTKFSVDDKSSWDWTMMMMQPEYVTPDLVEAMRMQVRKKKNLVLLSDIRFEPYAEGVSVQLMHIGPFSAEGPNIARMHAFAKEEGYELAGKHHEIYLNDFRKTAPERLKTVLRQPIRKQA
jgi:hypothetical protein